MRMRSTALFIALIAALPACDSNSVGPDGGNAVVTGSVEGDAGPASSQGPAPTSREPARQVQGAARTVVIGEVGSSGQFTALAEADVEADGRFRIEGVPSGRSNLVIRAQNETGAELGSVAFHETTQASVEHRAHPITARSTVHARTWTHMRASGQGTAMGSAELALFLHFSSESAASVATSSSAIEAIANAAVRGQAALSAVLASEGHTMSAEARNALLLALAAERDQARHAGAGPDAAQAAYVSAAFQAFEAAGVSAEALVLAHAAAATAFDSAMAGAQSAGSARIEVTRSALLVSLHGRERVASAVQGAALGLKSAAMTTIDLIEVRVRAAQSVSELEAALDEERASIEARVVGSVLASLPGLGGTVGAEVEAQLRSAIQGANLWADLEGAVDASATVEAVHAFRTRVQASAEDVMASLPTEVQAGVSVEVLVQLMISLGAGAGIA